MTLFGLSAGIFTSLPILDVPIMMKLTPVVRFVLVTLLQKTHAVSSVINMIKPSFQIVMKTV
ncbi:hypothetical protein D3C87_1929970 [compost metagenome]